jgi:hypothetical protein
MEKKRRERGEFGKSFDKWLQTEIAGRLRDTSRLESCPLKMTLIFLLIEEAPGVRDARSVLKRRKFRSGPERRSWLFLTGSLRCASPRSRALHTLDRRLSPSGRGDRVA